MSIVLYHTGKPSAAFQSFHGQLFRNHEVTESVIVGGLQTQTFPDGERYHCLNEEDIRGAHVILFGTTHNDSETLDMYDMARAIVKYGALRLTIVIPYWGYSTMERKTKQGEVVKAKSRACLFSSLPRAPHGNMILLMDLHTDSVYYFEGDIVPLHVYSKSVLLPAMQQLVRGKTYLASPHAKGRTVLASTDMGRAKWVESLGQDMGLETAFIVKKRLTGSKTKVLHVSAQVKDQRVLIYDDMIRTGGSLLAAAQAYKDAGARDIFAVAVHGVLPGDSLQKMQNSGLLSGIVITDSYPHEFTPQEVSHKTCPLQVITAAPALVEALLPYLR